MFMAFPKESPLSGSVGTPVKQETNFGEPNVTFFVLFALSVALLLFSGGSLRSWRRKKRRPDTNGVWDGGRNGTYATGFIYVAEESPLVPGRPNRLISYRISENGATQVAEIIDDEVALFDEGQVDTKKSLLCWLL